MTYIYSNTNKEYACYNVYGEKAGAIWLDGKEWVLYSEFTGEIGRFNSVDEAKACFNKFEEEETAWTD